MEAFPRPRNRLALELLGYSSIVFSLLVLGLGTWQHFHGRHFKSPGPMLLATVLGVLLVRPARSLDHAPRRNDPIALIAGILFLVGLTLAVLTSNPHFR